MVYCPINTSVIQNTQKSTLASLVELALYVQVPPSLVEIGGTAKVTRTLLFSSCRSLGVNPISTNKCTDDDPCPTCDELQNSTLTSSQGTLCQQSVAAVKNIARGVRQAIISCQSHFTNSRWNCSTFFGSDLFGQFINDGEYVCYN